MRVDFDPRKRMGLKALAGAVGGVVLAKGLEALGFESQAAGTGPVLSPRPDVSKKNRVPVGAPIGSFDRRMVVGTPVAGNDTNVAEFSRISVFPDSAKVSSREVFVTGSVPSFRVETDENNGFGVEGARKVMKVLDDVVDYYTKTFGPPMNFPDGPVLVAKTHKGSNLGAYSYGPSKDYSNGAVFVNSPLNEYGLAHEIKHKFPLPYEDSGLLQMDGVDHLGGELGTVAAARRYGINRRGVEATSLDEGSLLHQALRRDGPFFKQLSDQWIEAGRPDPKSINIKTWRGWSEKASPGFNEWLNMVREGPVADRKEWEDSELKWDSDARTRVSEGGYVRWYDVGLDWFMPHGSSSRRLGPNKYSVTKFAGGTKFPEVGPRGAVPYPETLYSPDQKPLGRWVRSKRQ